MGKKFQKITVAKSNEVSLCPTFNSGANLKTEFEIVKEKEAQNKVEPILEGIKKYSDYYCFCCGEELGDAEQAFLHYLSEWAEDRMNDAIYWLLKDDLDEVMYQIKWSELTKEEKAVEYAKLFNAFLAKFQELPITKNKDGNYEVSLVSKSRIQEQDTIPQNETNDITKEKTDKMENEEKNVVLKALDIIKTTLGLAKSETPAEETSEETPVEKTEGEATELPKEEKEEDKPAETQPAEEETPVVKSEEVEQTSEDVEKASKTIVEEEDEDEEVDDEEDAQEDLAEAEAKKKLAEEAKKKENELKKTSENQLEEMIEKNKNLEAELENLKKAQAEKEIEIEKMAFLQKAKDEFSMLAGTPEEIGEKLYAISKSNLDDASKTFILDSLKKVSENNSKMTEEVGSITKNADGISEEDKLYKQAEEIAKSKGISVNKALRQISSEQNK